MASNPGWRANLLLALGATIFSLALAAAGGEFLFRYREGHRDTVPGTMPFLFYRHSRLRTALVHNTDYFGWVKVNGEGFRGTEVAEDHPPGVFRIMAVGGSTTFDAMVGAEGRDWPARMAYWLGQADSARHVEVINAGVPGYIVLDNLIRLQTELWRYKPDLIVLYEGHNDLFAALRRGSQGPPPPPGDRPGEVATVTPWTHWLENHSLLYNKLLNRWQAISFRRAGATARQSSATNDQMESALGEGAEQFRRDLSGFLLLARNLGIPVVLVENPNISGPGAAPADSTVIRDTWRVAMPFASPEMVAEGYARYNQVIREVAAQFSLPCIAAPEFGIAGPAWYADGDAIHFNQQGADRMGQGMARALTASGALGKVAPGN